MTAALPTLFASDLSLYDSSKPRSYLTTPCRPRPVHELLQYLCSRVHKRSGKAWWLCMHRLQEEAGVRQARQAENGGSTVVAAAAAGAWQRHAGAANGDH